MARNGGGTYGWRHANGGFRLQSSRGAGPPTGATIAVSLHQLPFTAVVFRRDRLSVGCTGLALHMVAARPRDPRGAGTCSSPWRDSSCSESELLEGGPETLDRDPSALDTFVPSA
mmetsp:Transcript_61543/g.84716  ORF Transcript_61543/g.84716 Transcript_61543/m.84716 type:complete len:115 (-) Transcript_61543:783-1127(-)